MRSRWLVLVAVLASASVLLAQAPGSVVAKRGFLAEQVAAAKRVGKTVIEIDVMSQPTVREAVPGQPAGFVPSLGPHAVVLGVTEGGLPRAVATENAIFTWHEVRIAARLRERQATPEFGCEMPRPEGSPTLNSTHTAIATYGGTVTIDGVTVTMHEGESHVPILLALQRYILAGDFCKNGAFVLDDVEYPLAGDDVVLQPSGRPVTPRITLDEVIRLLRKAPNS
jgi:hypothetical protein